MLNLANGALKIFLALDPCDMRKSFNGLRHAGFLAHIRRKFTDLGTASPEVVVPVLLHIQRIYFIEKQVRPTKLGLKNWLFFGSLEAGANNALIHILLANCRVQGVDPEDYLVEVLKRLLDDATPDQAA